MANSPSMTTTDSKGASRKAEILKSAEYLVALHGYDALRLRDVAKDAGVSIGMIQHYFVTRDDLLRATIRSANERRVTQWAAFADSRDSPTVRLSALLEGSVTDHHRCVVWIETCAAAARHPELLDDVKRTQTAWRRTLDEVLQAGQMTGEFSPAESIEAIVNLLISLIDGLMLAVATDSFVDDHPVRSLRQVANRLVGTSLQ